MKGTVVKPWDIMNSLYRPIQIFESCTVSKFVQRLSHPCIFSKETAIEETWLQDIVQISFSNSKSCSAYNFVQRLFDSGIFYPGTAIEQTCLQFSFFSSGFENHVPRPTLSNKSQDLVPFLQALQLDKLGYKTSKPNDQQISLWLAEQCLCYHQC